eukprot:4603072-Amphidinium_carterae.1
MARKSLTTKFMTAICLPKGFQGLSEWFLRNHAHVTLWGGSSSPSCRQRGVNARSKGADVQICRHRRKQQKELTQAHTSEGTASRLPTPFSNRCADVLLSFCALLHYDRGSQKSPNHFCASLRPSPFSCSPKFYDFHLGCGSPAFIDVDSPLLWALNT